MVTLYTSPSCTSCRKARAWLEEHEIPYKERNIFSEPLSLDEIKEILRMTEDGTDEIISTRSKTFQKLNVDLDSLPLQELFELIQKTRVYSDALLLLMRSDFKLDTMKTKSVVFYQEK
ncbi:Regulatory protein spx [Listeria fleischmannii subsp. coloradonensis]|nr:Regulatory protein spx [Listeria fleischmannii subsp. coloradonensis]